MKTEPREKSEEKDPPVEAVNIIDGIPDRSERPRKWPIVALLALFVLWVAFLIYSQLTGSLPP